MVNPELYTRKVEEIMSKVKWTVNPMDTLSEALGKMKKYEVKELPVVEKGKLKGLLTFRTLAHRRKMPITAQVRNFMVAPPKIKPNDNIPFIAERLINRDFSSLPVTQRADLRGMVSRRDIITTMNSDPQISSIPVETIMNFAPTTINGKMGVKKAMNMMDLTRETYVAIVEDDHKFLGVVTHSSIMSFMEQPPTKMHTGDFHGEKVHRDQTISSIAEFPKTLSRDSSLKNVVDLMLKLKVPTVYITENDKLIGSVSEVDILEILLREGRRRGPLIQIAGIEDAKLMDASDLNTIITNNVAKIEKITNVSAVTVRIRHHHHDRDDDKYTVNVKLTTPGSVYAREAYDWDLKIAINIAFDNIEKGLKKDIGKKRRR
jgi:CBS domain-containing protein